MISFFIYSTSCPTFIYKEIKRKTLIAEPRIKISVNTDISVIGFYGNIENIGKISVDIFTHISVIKIFHILII